MRWVIAKVKSWKAQMRISLLFQKQNR